MHKSGLVILLLIVFSIGCTSQQSKILLEKELVSDLSSFPVYKNITKSTADGVQWKDNFQYLDDINIYKIVYLSDGLKVHGLLVEPKRAGKYPCIIYNRGGSNDYGQLVMFNAVLLGQMAKEGYVVIASQYRGNAGGEGQEEFGGSDVNDVTILPEVLEEVENADTSRIGMYGWSRGSMMTYIALTKMDNIKAAVAGAGNSDLTIIDRPIMEKKVYAELMPNYATNKDEELKKRSAVYWVDKFPKDVPILLLHGNADWRVKSTKSLKLALEFEKYRIPYRLKIFEGADHGIKQFRKERNDDVLAWFDKYLKRQEPLPNMEFHGN